MQAKSRESVLGRGIINPQVGGRSATNAVGTIFSITVQQRAENETKGKSYLVV